MAKKEYEIRIDVYKDALNVVLKMLKSGVHVENIIKYIEAVLHG